MTRDELWELLLEFTTPYLYEECVVVRGESPHQRAYSGCEVVSLAMEECNRLWLLEDCLSRNDKDLWSQCWSDRKKNEELEIRNRRQATEIAKLRAELQLLQSGVC